MSRTRTIPAPQRWAARTPWAALVIDVLLVVLFAALGRASHTEGLGLLGVLRTALPFLAGLLAAWAALVATRRVRPGSLAGGLVVWPATVVVGMILRALSGQGTAASFVAVTLAVTGLFLVGWRALAARLARRSA